MAADMAIQNDMKYIVSTCVQRERFEGNWDKKDPCITTIKQYLKYQDDDEEKQLGEVDTCRK